MSLAILPEYAFLKDDLILTALFGGVFSGVGTGMMLLCHATTGGTDTMAALIHTKLRHYSINQISRCWTGWWWWPAPGFSACATPFTR